VPLLWVTKKADEPFSCFSDHSFAVASGLDSFPERMKEVPARFNSISGQKKTRRVSPAGFRMLAGRQIRKM